MSINAESTGAESARGDWRALMDHGKLNEAQELLAEWLAAKPDDGDALHDLGVICARLKKFDEAVGHFRAATIFDPARHQSWRNLARAYSDLGKLDEAEACLIKLTELQPDSARAHELLGLLQRRARRYEGAAATLSKAVALDPNVAKLHHELGTVLVHLKRQKDAKASFLRAIELDATSAESFNHLGVLCQEMGQMEEAIKYLQESVRLRPDVVGGYNNLGVAYSEDRQFEKAVDAYNKAVALAPEYTIAWNNLGNALRSLGENQAAIVALERAISQKKDYAEAYNNLAIALVQQGEHERAMACYNKSLRLRPDYPECHMNRGLEWLMLGDLANGWADYEWRWHLKTLRSRKFTQPRWDGSPLGGKRILLHYEQGLGDTIQFIRYGADLKRRGATVIFEGQRVLQHMLFRTAGIDEFVPRGDKLPPFDVHTPLLSLPPLFETTLATIPCDIPYVFPDPYFVKIWKPRLESIKGFKVGIAWQGNPEHRGDRLRSIPLRLFASLAGIEGVRLISLQKNAGVEQLAGLDGQFEVLTFDGIDEEADGFLRTAAIMHGLDLVISADTAVVHLAGAMGLPVWCLISVANDWRWMTEREDSPWYPTLRLFRQREPGDWEELFVRVAHALRERMVAGMCTQSSRHLSASGDTQDKLRRAADLIKEDCLAEAEKMLEEAAASDPASPAAQHDLGVVYGREGKVHKAIERFRRSLELKPDQPSGYGNLGLAYLQAGMAQESISALHKVIRLGAATPEAYNHLGLAQMKVPDPAAAEANYLKALHLRPDYVAAHCNLSHALLAQGKFEQGWLEREWRWKATPDLEPVFSQPRWIGEALKNQRILLYAEKKASVSDILLFVRYASVVRDRGGEVVLECPEGLVELLRHVDGIAEVSLASDGSKRFDVHAPLLSLPSILETTLKTVPAPIPYIHADPKLGLKWRQRVDALGFNIGISWRDWTRRSRDGSNALSPLMFQPLTQIEGTKFLNLQHDSDRKELGSMVARFPFTDLAREQLFDESNQFANLAAVISSLDLVITADTPLAHLAGAMGKPVWLLLPASAHYRWLTGREDSPWYRTLKIFRQQRSGDWAPVFDRVREELSSHVSAWATNRGEVMAATSAPTRTSGEDGVDPSAQGDVKAADENLAAEQHTLAISLAKKKQYVTAFAHFQASLRLCPNSPHMAGNYALALLENGDYQLAEVEMRPLAERFPSSAVLQYRTARVLERLGDHEAALRFVGKCLAISPHSADAHYLLGRILLAQGKPSEAVAALRSSLELQPERAERHLRLGDALSAVGDHSGAVDAYKAALRKRPQYAEAQRRIGTSFLHLGRIADASRSFQAAVYLMPHDAAAHVDLAKVLLIQANYEQGWLEFEWRLRVKGYPERKLPGKRWRGGPLAGKRLLVTAEQSLADTIQMVRFTRLAKAAGAHVILECPQPLVSLLSRFPGVDEVITQGDELPSCDVHSPVLSLPMGLGIRAEGIYEGPYIKVDPVKVEQWARVLSVKTDRPRIGVVGCDEFGASPTARSETIRLDQIAAQAGVGEVEFISLQRDPALGRSTSPGFPIRHIFDPDGAVPTLSDLAAIITSLDSVIGCDGVVSHLAAAMGVRVLLLLTDAALSCWMGASETTLWYPTMRLIRFSHEN